MILALDSSSSIGSVALVENGEVVNKMSVETPRGRGGALFEALQKILQDRPCISRVVAGTGPGSYNGIRSALAAGWGIATAREVPFVGVSTLLGLGEGNYSAAGDARRGQFYFARVRDGAFADEPILLERDELLARIGVDEPLYAPAEMEFLPQAIIRFPDTERLAVIGAGMKSASGCPEPLYLKPPHITTPLGVPAKATNRPLIWRRRQR